MPMLRLIIVLFTAALMIAAAFAVQQPLQRSPLDPRGQIHIPIGIANTVDTLKTFVEPEGCFSPGLATCGIYFWLWDGQKLTAPTMDGVPCEHGLPPGGYLIPFSQWKPGPLLVRTELCQVQRPSPAGLIHLVAARAIITNTSDKDSTASLYVALRPLGPAGGPVNHIALSDDASSLLVDAHPALVSARKPSAAGVAETDTIAQLAAAGKMPLAKVAASPNGQASGALRFDLTIPPGRSQTLAFICPVLPGRRAVAHQWDGKNPWAQLDDAKPNPDSGGLLQPDPGLAYYLQLNCDQLFDDARAYWKDLAGRVSISLPDPLWADCYAAITAHLALCMNDNAPDVAVVNYNVFNRDGMYSANLFHKAARPELAERAIDYFLSHPFNGRIHPEADNPGQILWIMGEHWLFTRDKTWLQRVYPSLRKLVAMVRYYRTTPTPHWVALDGLDFGPSLPPDKRKELKPGSCDGYHPEYTEAYDISGLRKAALLARALGNDPDADDWANLADDLFARYQQKFAKRLPKDYGSYAVLWPCRLYPYDQGDAYEAFKSVGPQRPAGWRYFALATAHQGLLAGNRAAGYGTIDQHLRHQQMAGWFAFDEGGDSGAGGWRHARTTWNSAVAMPHGWAIAEMALLLRDSLAFEDGDKLVLLAGVPEMWFTSPQPMKVESLPTHFGTCSFRYELAGNTATLTISGTATPPGGFLLRLPHALKASCKADGQPLAADDKGNLPFPAAVKSIQIEFPSSP